MKKVLIVLIALVLCVVFIGCSKAPVGETAASTESQEVEDNGDAEVSVDEGDAEAPAEKDKYNIGVSFASFENPVYAEIAEYIKVFGDEKNMEITAVSCDNDSLKQITQIENFISGGYDGICILTLDVESLTTVTKQAMDAGVAVFSLGNEIENAHISEKNPEFEIGTDIGKAAGEFINEKYNGKAEVGFLDMPQNKDLLLRGDGIRAGLKEVSPESEIVLTTAATTVSEGVNAMETFLQTKPDIRVIVSIGDGAAIGANEVVNCSGLDIDEFGIFAADSTKQACQAIKNNEAFRATTSLGGSKNFGKMCVDGLYLILTGAEYDKIVYPPVFAVNSSNVEEYCKDVGYELD